MNKKFFLCLFSFLILPLCSCTVPQYIWPQKDIGSHEVNEPTLKDKILIASRESEFKDAIVRRIEDVYSRQAVYIKVVGIEDLKYEDAAQYSAIVLINTAMGWRIDRKVDSFLNRYQDLNSIIVLTTSDGGNISPDPEKHQIDAISSASILDSTELVSNKIISKISKLIKKSR